ncbi:MAG: DNA alkylation repair protein [Bacteroidetes bacterium]|nr:DNA alkylation repair protein [Bacteroidota bacterium]
MSLQGAQRRGNLVGLSWIVRDCFALLATTAGWMLRKIGKRNQETEEGFLQKHHRSMPRTMLRYSIERFTEPLRIKYLERVL